MTCTQSQLSASQSIYIWGWVRVGVFIYEAQNKFYEKVQMGVSWSLVVLAWVFRNCLNQMYCWVHLQQLSSEGVNIGRWFKGYLLPLHSVLFLSQSSDTKDLPSPLVGTSLRYDNLNISDISNQSALDQSLVSLLSRDSTNSSFESYSIMASQVVSNYCLIKGTFGQYLIVTLWSK